MLSTNPGSAASQPWDGHLTPPEPCVVQRWWGRGLWGLPENLVWKGDALDWPQPLGPHGGCALRSRGTGAQQNPHFPHASFLSLAWGGGPQLFHYLAVSRPRKGFLEPMGGSLSPSPVSWSADWRQHPHGLSLPCSPGAMQGFSRAYGYCKNSLSSLHCSSMNLCRPRWLSEQPIVGRLDGSIIAGCRTQLPPRGDVFQGMTPKPPHQEGLVPPFQAFLRAQAVRHFTSSSQADGAGGQLLRTQAVGAGEVFPTRCHSPLPLRVLALPSGPPDPLATQALREPCRNMGVRGKRQVT